MTEKSSESFFQNFFKKKHKTINSIVYSNQSDALDVQSAPIMLTLNKGKEICYLKVDGAYVFESNLIVEGWSTGALEIGLESNGISLDFQKKSVSRTDVAKNLALPYEKNLGFVLVAPIQDNSNSIELTWRSRDELVLGKSKPLQLLSNFQPDNHPNSNATLALQMMSASLLSQSPAWQSIVARIPPSTTECKTAYGFLEGGVVSSILNEAVVVGWVVHVPEAKVWLQDDSGNVWPIKGYKYFRKDVHDKYGKKFGYSNQLSGFLIRIQGAQWDSKLDLKVWSGEAVHLLSSTSLGQLPMEPAEAAKWLFNIVSPEVEFHKRIAEIDAPVITSLISSQASTFEDLPCEVRMLGTPVAQPLVSLIIPLYGRSDFVEHQFIEFSEDVWLQENAEIIYVIDDQNLLENFVSQAEFLYRLYRLPFKWVWGSANRGFSGANNLGFEYAVAPTVIFLNSDVIPQKAGWAKDLMDILMENPIVGAVGPRLVFADGSIQHAGMSFERREDLGIWLNRHPYMGMDPSTDPKVDLVVVPAVTGACIAMRRTDLERVGGWDTGYLIGDFEDSDLCLKLRSQGQHIVYTPKVQLTHLERQSFKLLGESGFRQRVVIYNGVRHQSRWRDLLSEAPISEEVEQ
jgi:GT2 family glycosyltransferase